MFPVLGCCCVAAVVVAVVAESVVAVEVVRGACCSVADAVAEFEDDAAAGAAASPPVPLLGDGWLRITLPNFSRMEADAGVLCATDTEDGCPVGSVATQLFCRQGASGATSCLLS